MITVETWQLFGGLLAIIIALGGASLGLQRLGIIRPKDDATPTAPADAAPETSLIMEVGAVREHAAVIKESVDRLDRRILEAEKEIAALDERSKSQGDTLSRIGRVHSRIDDISGSLHTLIGTVDEMRQTQNRIDEFLRNQSVLRP